MMGGIPMEVTGENEFSKVLAWKIDLALMVVHICLLLFFAAMHIWLMVGVNVLSVGVYAMMVRISRQNPYLFLFATFCEIFVHMVLAIICVGWDFGFQLYCFSLVPVIFYCDYMGKSTRAKTCHPIMVSIMVVMTFLGLWWYVWHRGALYQVENTVVAMVGNMMNAGFDFVFLILYMANYERLTIHTEHVASKDELTGLNNRHKMRDIMQVVEKRQEKQENLAFSILDIDDFKKINDTYGHNVGDQVLQAVARKIEGLENDHMYVCRWGGEEFLIMSSGEKCYETLKSAMDFLIQEIRGIVVPCGNDKIRVTITAGAARSRSREAVDETISRADKYLYEGKLSGKNRLVARDM